MSSVAAGQAVYGPEVARRPRAFFSVGGGTAQPFPELTDREREVLALMAAGLNNTDNKTVRNRVSSICAKLGVPDRAAAIVRAREAVLGTQPT